jgi:hypothetical protein
VKNGELNPCPACKESAIATFSYPRPSSGGTEEKLKYTAAKQMRATTAIIRTIRQCIAFFWAPMETRFCSAETDSSILRLHM